MSKILEQALKYISVGETYYAVNIFLCRKKKKYDKNGNLIKQTECRGKVTRNLYDGIKNSIDWDPRWAFDPETNTGTLKFE